MTMSKKIRVMMSERGRPEARTSSSRRAGVVMIQSMYRTYCHTVSTDRHTQNLEETHPDLPGGAGGVREVGELSLDRGRAEVGGHGEVRDRSRGQNDNRQLVEDPLAARDGKVPTKDDQVRE